MPGNAANGIWSNTDCNFGRGISYRVNKTIKPRSGGLIHEVTMTRHHLKTLFHSLWVVLVMANVCAENVLTQHNDLSRTGADLEETILTPANVNSNQFGKLFVRNVDGQVYAQPLYVQGLAISNQTHNVVYVCTENNSVYAFDADNPGATNALWQVNLGPAVPYTDVNGCYDLEPLIGITSTPVIDLNTGTIYVEDKTVEMIGSTNYYYQKLHALDLTTGREKFGGPVTIQGAVGGITFNAQHGNQRSGLLLLSNVVYLAFSSHCDWTPYNGWLFGYNSTNLSQVAIFNATPSSADGEGGIWACGMAPAADTNGNIYVATGNGTFDAESGGTNYGMCFLKLSTTNGLEVADWFSPYNEASLSGSDLDLGSGGPVLLPGTHLLVGLDKVGTMFLLDQNNLGHFSFNGTSDTNIVQEFTATPQTDTIGQSPVYWQGPTNQFIFISCGNGQTTAFGLIGTNIETTPLGAGSVTQDDRAGGLSLSANGTNNGILWAIDYGSGGTLRAYDAANMPTELWDSQQNSARDALGAYVKFVSPTIANGKVYVATDGQLVVYGLLNVSSAFSLSATPASRVAGTQSNSVSYLVTATGTNGFAGRVALSVSGLPANTTASFNPPSVSGSGSSTLTLANSDNVPPGVYTLTITGTAGGYTNVTTAALTVATTPDFTVFTMLGTNLVFGGTNGLPLETYYLLSSTNLALPLTNWSVVATNMFDVNGNFDFTNGMSPGFPRQFYLLQPH